MYGAHKLFPRLDGRYGNISFFSYISVLKYELSVLYITDVLRDPERSHKSLSNMPVVTRSFQPSELPRFSHRGVNFRIVVKVQQQGSALDFLVSFMMILLICCCHYVYKGL